MLDTTIAIRTDNFDGPLSLLLLLIQKEEMDIRELDLTLVTKHYLAYLAQMKELDFDLAGEYLYLAATLLLLKSKDSITEDDLTALGNFSGNQEGTITSKSELIRRLEELALYQKMGVKLFDLPKKGVDIFVKSKVDRKAIINSILTPMNLTDLTMSMVDFIKREKRKYKVVKRDRLSIREKLAFLKGFLKEGQKTTFTEVLTQDGQEGVDNIIITFISLLELARLKKLSIFQGEDAKEIYVDVLSSLNDFDVDVANGFDTKEESDQEFNKELKNSIDNQISEVH